VLGKQLGTVWEIGLVSKGIRANYLNGQTGLFKLVRVSARVMRVKEKPNLSTNDEILFPEFEMAQNLLLAKSYQTSTFFAYYKRTIFLLLPLFQQNITKNKSL
jgi:hypothetical protein